MAVIDRFKSLSPRQVEIAMFLADGLTNTDIAEKLGLTVHTVKAHRAEVMRRMESTSFADLVAQLQNFKSVNTTLGAKRSSPLRIIVIENDKWYREFLADNLNERGFIAVGVADGDDAGVVVRNQRAGRRPQRLRNPASFVKDHDERLRM